MDSKLELLHKNDPSSKIIGDFKDLKKLSLVQKVADLVKKVHTMSMDSDNLKDVALATSTVLKVLESFSKNPVILLEEVKKLSEEDKIIFTSFLEQHNIKKSFETQKIRLKDVV